MSERKRFISPEPKLARLLRQREPRILPRELWDWGVDWVEDVGSVMRSRGYMVSTVAFYAGLGLSSFFLRLLPDVTLLDKFLKRLGFRE